MRIQSQLSKTLKMNHVIVNKINMKQQKWKKGDFLTLFYLSWDENSRSYIQQSRIFRILFSSKECLVDHIIVNKVDSFTLGIGPFSKVIAQKLILNISPKKIFLMRL